MYPNWLQVEYAIIFFMSVCTKATVAAKKAVVMPIIVIKFSIKGEYS